MSKIWIAVCDADKAYAEKLAEWISLEKGRRCSSISFSSPDCFWNYYCGKKPDIVLLGGGFAEDSRICAELSGKEGDAKGREVFWMRLHDANGGGQIPDYISELPLVEKYQPAPQILREIFFACQDWRGREQGAAGGNNELIAVYSPAHSIWQTPFALTFAQSLGQKQKVLYVNLKECAGFEEWFQVEYEKDLLDVMYLCLANEVNVSHCVSASLYTMEGIDYIPPAKDGECLGEISSRDYARFVKLLTINSGYDVILLDFGMMIPGFYKLLEMCSQVYVVKESGDLQEGPIRQFQEMTARREELELAGKFIYLTIPAAEAQACPGAGRLQQWLWSALGDFSRRLAGV